MVADLILPVFLLILGAFVVASFAVLHEWRLKQLRWRILSVRNCRNYLLANGWTEPWRDEFSPRLDKGDLQIIIACAVSEPATLGAVLSATDGGTNEQRHCVVFVPGAVQPGLVDEMLRRRVSVVPYQKMGRLEAILREHEITLQNNRAYERRILTAALEPPTAAKVLWASPVQEKRLNSETFDGLIAKTERVQCFLRDRGADQLLIAFNDSWRCGPGGRFDNGIDIAALGYSIVDFVTCEPNWFPADDMAALVPLIEERFAHRFTWRVTFGFSQGGYGAIKYSRALGATATVAFSPQFSIDPRVVGSERFAEHYKSHANLGMGIEQNDCTCATFLFYDNYYDHDCNHVELISEQVAFSRILVPFAGHATWRLFDTPDRLKQLLWACEMGDTAALIRLAAETRTRNVDRAFHMAMYLAAVSPDRALAIAEKYRSSWGANEHASFCYRLAMGGKLSVAFSWLEGLAAANPDSEEIQGCAALVALRSGRLDRAFHFVERARELNPFSAKWVQLREDIRVQQFAA